MRVQLKNQIIEVPILVSEGYDTEELRVSVRADAMIWSEGNSFMVLKYDYNQKSWRKKYIYYCFKETNCYQ